MVISEDKACKIVFLFYFKVQDNDVYISFVSKVLFLLFFFKPRVVYTDRSLWKMVLGSFRVFNTLENTLKLNYFKVFFFLSFGEVIILNLNLKKKKSYFEVWNWITF